MKDKKKIINELKAKALNDFYFFATNIIGIKDKRGKAIIHKIPS